MTVSKSLSYYLTSHSSYYIYCASRVLNGFAFVGSSISLIVLNNELTGSKGRGMASAIYSTGFALGKQEAFMGHVHQECCQK